MSLFRRLFESSDAPARTNPVQPDPEVPASIPGIRTDVTEDGALVTVDLDELGSELRPSLLDELTQRSGLPVFEGHVEHGYAMRSFAPARCPRCDAATRQQMAHFIYATDIAPRVMFAPAGYFCIACPTVVIDEDLVAGGMKEGYRFRSIVGIDYAGEKEPDLFKTWNGQEPIYVLDEEGRIMDLIAKNQLHADAPTTRAGAHQEATARKRRRKLARQSRKRNRR